MALDKRKPVESDTEGAIEELLEMEELIRRVQSIDLDVVERAKDRAKDPLQRTIEKVQRSGTLKRKLKNKTGVGRTPKPKKHWKVKARERKSYYYTNIKPQRQRKLIEQLKTCEGWYKYVTRLWSGKMLSYEEFEDVVWPLILAGYVPTFRRYTTSKGFTLDNLVIRHSDSDEVIFDGKEYEMKRLGYIL